MKNDHSATRQRVHRAISPFLNRAAIALIALNIGFAKAANANWTGGSTDALWSNTANWSATPVPGTGNTATFNAAAGAGGAVIDLGSGVTVNTITFASSSVAAYTIGAGTVNSQSLTLNGAGNAGLAGSGTGGTNTNQITINAGITVNNTQQWILSNGANPWIINGNVTPNGTAGSTIQVKINGHRATFNGLLVDQIGGAKLQISGANAQTATLTNPNNSFTGGLYFDNGSVSVNSIDNIGSNSAAGAGGDLLFGSGFGGGSLIYTGTGNETNRVVKFNNGFHGATINQSGASGILKFTADLAPTAIGSQTLALNGAAAGTGEFSGKIVDNGTVGTTQVKTGGNGVTTLVLNSVDGITIGSSVSGTGIAVGTTVTAINTGTRQITLSAVTTANVAANATITVSGVKNVTHLSKNGSGTWTLSNPDNTYSGNTTVSAGTLIVNGGLRIVVTNSAANKVTGAGSVTLNSPFNIDTSAVTSSSGSWTLIDTATLNESFGGSFSLPGFTGPVSNVYSKTTGVQKWTFNRSTGVLSLTSDAIITSFGIPGSTGVINQNDKTIALTVPYIPWGTSGLASLAPNFTLTSGTCNQTSGAPPSPTFAVANPATYTVTDGATVNDYTVTVTVEAPSTACDILTFGLPDNAGVIDSIAQTSTMSVPVGVDVTSLAPTYTVSASATGAPPSGTTRDFTNPQTYTVTAQDGTTQKTYTVTVRSYQSWTHSGTLFILTDATGANLPPSVSESNFPLLVRFNSSNFAFAQAASDGSDIRFSTLSGIALPYEIEEWDSINGEAAVWVKIPAITGNERQEIKMFWGNPGVSSQSNGPSVFNSSNGYCAVMHLNGNVLDATGSTSPLNGGATPATAVIGNTAMNLSTGDITAANITNFPSGLNPASTGQIWLRARDVTNWSMPLAWGNKNAYGWNTWQMQIGFWGSPTVLPSYLTCRGPAVLSGTTNLEAGEWYHLVYTNSGGTARLYVNGVLDATITSASNITINNPQALSLGMAGGDADVDEARISSVARSADWVKLEYENQKPIQTLVGGLVPGGADFSVSPTSVTMNENSGTTLTAQAGGAQKTYWIYIKNGQETVLATDQLTFDYSAGRITGNDSATIRFKAVFASDVQTIDVPLTVIDTIPDPAFTLMPSTTTWDGRQTMTVTANISNLAAMQDAGFADLNYNWSVSGVAVIKEEYEGMLTLTRSQGSGPMTVALTIDNGGTPVSQSTIITVQEPASDPWLERTPAADEKPVDKQFFARNSETNQGTIFYNGTQTGSPDSVYLKVYKTPSGGSETLDTTYRQPLVGGAYAFSAPITAGLITYRVVYGTTTGGVDSDVATVNDLVCGDAFVIEGQSNALALQNTAPADNTTSKWVRTYSLTAGWGYAVKKSSTSPFSNYQLGVWGWYLANRLMTNNDMPICIINGAVGGTRIDQHRPNPEDHGTAGALYSIYANLYNRVVNARLSHGIRAVLWHQGEQDQGAEGPDGDYNHKFYQQYFVDISASWKQDFPNIRNYYIFQIWPAACGDPSRNDQLREVQRTLPFLYSNMKIMSTLGIVPGASCHYDETGYIVFSDLIGPLVEEDVYGDVPPAPLTAPNLLHAYFTTPEKNAIALVFDQNVAWNPGALSLLFLANAAGTTSGSVSSGSASGNTITLQVSGAASATAITYVKGLVSWQQANLLYGTNGIAALTFADVAIGLPSGGYDTWANGAPFEGDANNDGVKNGMAWVLGATDPTVNASALVPALEQEGELWVFEYSRHDESLPPASTQVVQYGSDLAGWTDITIPATSSGAVTIIPGTPADHVRVVIPSLGGKMFARLKVTQ